MMKSVPSIALVLTLLVSCLAGLSVSADEGYTAKLGFINKDWSTQEWGDNASTAVTGAGEYSITFNAAATEVLFFVVDIVGAFEEFSAKNMGLTALSVLVDGVEIPVDLSKVITGDPEEKGNFRIEIYNEYGSTKENPPIEPAAVNFAATLTVNFTIGTLEAAPEGSMFDLFIAYAGDRAERNDCGYEYYGADTEKSTGITAVNARICSGQTATISLTFENAPLHSRFFSPCLVAEDITDIIGMEYDITCKVNGEDVAINMEADSQGRTWWAEGTGDYSAAQCIRLAGGYDELATHYVYVPGSFTTIEYTITFRSITIAMAEEQPPVVEIDPMGTYHAYLMLQTPNRTFRNAHDDAFYGVEGSSWEALGLTWGQYLVHPDHPGKTWGTITDAVITGNGTYSVKITDFGTIFADDFEVAAQEHFNIIALSTDLPAGANVTITNVELVIDGQVRHTYGEAYVNEESTGSLQVLLQNIWNSGVKEINYYPVPNESLEIRFTIAGFGYDKESEGGEKNPENPAQSPEHGDSIPTPVPRNNTLWIIIVAVIVVAAAIVVVNVLKKKKA